MGFIDPPREEAKAAIAECRSAGIAVKMITGDHLGTALAIARQLKISENVQGLTGKELETLSDDALAARALGVDVFARSSPEHARTSVVEDKRVSVGVDIDGTSIMKKKQ